MSVMIKGFKNKETEAVFNGIDPGGIYTRILRVARRKLQMVHAAKVLTDLKAPPTNFLHPLKNDRAGQHAIRINKQYRVCFRWNDDGVTEVEITDYHD